jgi:hypothetical protein
MKKTFKVLPIMAITMAVVPLAIVASCTSEEDNYLPGPPINPVPPVNPIPPVPPVVEVKPTQATLDAAIKKAKAQYANVVLDVNNNFLTQNYDTVEEMNADMEFVGMVNFNKDNRQITVNENGMSFIFDSTVTKVEVNAGMTEIKVF